MYCLHCDYDLRGLPEDRCPECGESFDPDDRASFKDRPGDRGRWLMRFTVAGTLYPVVAFALVHSTWLVAAMKLGRFPRASLDDPKDIGHIVDWFQTMTYMWLAAFPIGIIAYPLAMVVLLLRHRASEMPSTLPAWIVASFLAWIGLLAYFMWDPCRILTWFFD